MSALKLPYNQQLLDPRWQKRRLEILEEAQWKCEDCGDSTKTLHVHHVAYNRGWMAWEYDRNYLKALCVDCHSNRADLEHDLMLMVKALDIGKLNTLVGLLAKFIELDSLPFFISEIERHSHTLELIARAGLEALEKMKKADQVKVPIGGLDVSPTP